MSRKDKSNKKGFAGIIRSKSMKKPEPRSLYQQASLGEDKFAGQTSKLATSASKSDHKEAQQESEPQKRKGLMKYFSSRGLGDSDTPKDGKSSSSETIVGKLEHTEMAINDSSETNEDRVVPKRGFIAKMFSFKSSRDFSVGSTPDTKVKSGKQSASKSQHAPAQHTSYEWGADNKPVSPDSRRLDAEATLSHSNSTDTGQPQTAQSNRRRVQTGGKRAVSARDVTSSNTDDAKSSNDLNASGSTRQAPSSQQWQEESNIQIRSRSIDSGARPPAGEEKVMESAVSPKAAEDLNRSHTTISSIDSFSQHSDDENFDRSRKNKFSQGKGASKSEGTGDSSDDEEAPQASLRLPEFMSQRSGMSSGRSLLDALADDSTGQEDVPDGPLLRLTLSTSNPSTPSSRHQTRIVSGNGTISKPTTSVLRASLSAPVTPSHASTNHLHTTSSADDDDLKRRMERVIGAIHASPVMSASPPASPTPSRGSHTPRIPTQPKSMSARSMDTPVGGGIAMTPRKPSTDLGYSLSLLDTLEGLDDDAGGGGSGIGREIRLTNEAISTPSNATPSATDRGSLSSPSELTNPTTISSIPDRESATSNVHTQQPKTASSLLKSLSERQALPAAAPAESIVATADGPANESKTPVTSSTIRPPFNPAAANLTIDTNVYTPTGSQQSAQSELSTGANSYLRATPGDNQSVFDRDSVVSSPNLTGSDKVAPQSDPDGDELRRKIERFQGKIASNVPTPTSSTATSPAVGRSVSMPVQHKQSLTNESLKQLQSTVISPSTSNTISIPIAASDAPIVEDLHRVTSLNRSASSPSPILKGMSRELSSNSLKNVTFSTQLSSSLSPPPENEASGEGLDIFADQIAKKSGSNDDFVAVTTPSDEIISLCYSRSRSDCDQGTNGVVETDVSGEPLLGITIDFDSVDEEHDDAEGAVKDDDMIVQKKNIVQEKSVGTPQQVSNDVCLTVTERTNADTSDGNNRHKPSIRNDSRVEKASDGYFESRVESPSRRPVLVQKEEFNHRVFSSPKVTTTSPIKTPLITSSTSKQGNSSPMATSSSLSDGLGGSNSFSPHVPINAANATTPMTTIGEENRGQDLSLSIDIGADSDDDDSEISSVRSQDMRTHSNTDVRSSQQSSRSHSGNMPRHPTPYHSTHKISKSNRATPKSTKSSELRSAWAITRKAQLEAAAQEKANSEVEDFIFTMSPPVETRPRSHSKSLADSFQDTEPIRYSDVRRHLQFSEANSTGVVTEAKAAGNTAMRPADKYDELISRYTQKSFVSTETQCSPPHSPTPAKDSTPQESPSLQHIDKKENKEEEEAIVIVTNTQDMFSSHKKPPIIIYNNGVPLGPPGEAHLFVSDIMNSVHFATKSLQEREAYANMAIRKELDELRKARERYQKKKYEPVKRAVSEAVAFSSSLTGEVAKAMGQWDAMTMRQVERDPSPENSYAGMLRLLDVDDDSSDDDDEAYEPTMRAIQARIEIRKGFTPSSASGRQRGSSLYHGESTEKKFTSPAHINSAGPVPSFSTQKHQKSANKSLASQSPATPVSTANDADRIRHAGQTPPCTTKHVQYSSRETSGRGSSMSASPHRTRRSLIPVAVKKDHDKLSYPWTPTTPGVGKVRATVSATTEKSPRTTTGRPQPVTSSSDRATVGSARGGASGGSSMGAADRSARGQRRDKHDASITRSSPNRQSRSDTTSAAASVGNSSSRQSATYNFDGNKSASSPSGKDTQAHRVPRLKDAIIEEEKHRLRTASAVLDDEIEKYFTLGGLLANTEAVTGSIEKAEKQKAKARAIGMPKYAMDVSAISFADSSFSVDFDGDAIQSSGKQVGSHGGSKSVNTSNQSIIFDMESRQALTALQEEDVGVDSMSMFYFLGNVYAGVSSKYPQSHGTSKAARNHTNEVRASGDTGLVVGVAESKR